MKSIFVLPLIMFSISVFADVAQNIVIEQSFVRAAIQQQRNSAAFMGVTNQGHDASITYAKSSVAKVVELHTHINDKGVMRMRKIKQIDLPRQQKISLKPGGLHVMLLGLNRDLKPGEQIEVTLGFNDGSEKLLQIPVQKMNMRKKKNLNSHKQDGSLPKMLSH